MSVRLSYKVNLRMHVDLWLDENTNRAVSVSPLGDVPSATSACAPFTIEAKTDVIRTCKQRKEVMRLRSSVRSFI